MSSQTSISIFRPLGSLRFAGTVVGALALSTLASAQVGGGIYLPFNDAPLGDPGVLLNGNVAVSLPSPDFSIDPTGEMLAELSVEGTLTAEIRSTASVAFQENIGFGNVILPPIQVSPLISVQPILILSAEIEGQAQPDMVVSLVQGFEFGVRIETDGKPSIRALDKPAATSLFGVPEFLGNGVADARISVNAEMLFFVQANGFSTAGPFIEASFGSEFRVDPAVDPWWSIRGFLEVDAGITAVGFGLLRRTVFSGSFPISDAGEAFGGSVPSTRWSKVFDLDETEDATSVLPLSDGFLLAGNGQGPNNQAWFAKLDEVGSPLWQQLADPLLIGSRPAEVHELPGNSFLAGGMTSLGGSPRVQTLDSQGALLTSTRYTLPTGGSLRLESILPTATGSVYVGQVARGGIDQASLVYVDANGDIEDAFELDLTGFSDDAGFLSVEPTPDGGLLAVGFVHYEDTPVFVDQTIAGVNALLVKFSANRTLEYALAYGGTGSDQALDVSVNSDGTFGICGLADGQANRAWVAHLDDQARVEWSAVYGGDTDGGNDVFHSIDSVDGAGYLVAGTHGVGVDQEAWTMMTSARGMPLWFKSLRSPDLDELVEVQALPDGMIVCGTTKATGPNAFNFTGDLWTARTSVDGMMHFTAASGLDAVNDAAQWSRTFQLVQVDTAGTLIPLAVTATHDSPTFSPTLANETVVSD